MDALNYDEETKSFLNKYLKPGKISYQKYIEKKILEPRINDDKLKATLKNDTKTIDYALGGGGNGQILAMPHFPDAHRIDNANQTLSHNAWTIKSSLNTVSNQGLSAILKDSARRVKTQTITEIRQVAIDNKVIFYTGHNFGGSKIAEFTSTTYSIQTEWWFEIGSIKIPSGWHVEFWRKTWDPRRPYSSMFV